MTDTLLISELSARTGFSRSALRYYEQVGLLDAAKRNPSGYRVFDETAVDRLRFIDRAKQLGLPLDEIRDLVSVWEGEHCQHVQDELRTRIESKSSEVKTRIGELSAFAAELQAALGDLSEPAGDGPCHDGCGCADSAPVTRVSENPELNPVACTLEVGDQAERLTQWRAVLEHVQRREPIEGGLRMSFRPAPDLAIRLADLAARELACCSFFRFTLGLSSDVMTLDVVAPGVAAEMLDELLAGAR